MNSKMQWKPMVAGAAAALMLTLGTAAVYPQVTQAVDATPAAPEQARQGGPAVDHDELMAEALGITTDELQAAHAKALDAALTQAVEKDLLTQTQADALRERMDGKGAQGFGRFGFALGRFEGFMGGDIDFAALLADALGISVDELDAAREQAQSAAVAQAVEDGVITQEQADLGQAWRAFRNYWAEQQPTVEDQLKAAVTAGAITQEQADLLLKEQAAGNGFGGRGGFGPGMMGPDMGRGMHDGKGFGPGMMGPDGGRGMHDGKGFGPGMMEPGMGRGMHDGDGFGPGMGGHRGRGGFPSETPSDDQAPQGSSSQVVPASSF